MWKYFKKIIPAPLKQLHYRLRTLRKIRKPRVFRYPGERPDVLQACLAYNEYGGYCVPLESYHRPAAQTILAGKVFESDTLHYILQQTGRGDIVHAGTYFGDFLPALSKACQAGFKVWAFEPNPNNYRCAVITASINQLENVEIRNLGLGKRAEELPMIVSDPSGRSLGGGSSIIAEGDHTSGAAPSQLVAVKMTSLEEVIPAERPLALIQLDVEGFEEPALLGALSLIKRWKPTLILETLPSAAFLDQYLHPLGYKKVDEIHENSILICADDERLPGTR